jgi:hypothetical protein
MLILNPNFHRMNKLLVSSLIWATVTLSSHGNLPDDPAEYAAWEATFLAAIKSQEDLPPERSIPQLGIWLLKLSTGMNVERGERPVFHAAQRALLAIPGHANYYQEKIESLRSEVLENAAKPTAEIEAIRAAGREVVDYNTYANACGTAFPVLGLLPSSETVAVLGHYLNDPEGRDGKTLLGDSRYRGDVYPYPANAEEAAAAIGKLGIENPPWVKPKSISEGDTDREVNAWKDWWNEVKGGQRTYRFKGSSIEYGADGPVASKKREMIERPQKRSSETDSYQKDKTGFTVAIIAAVSVLLILVLWSTMRRTSSGGGCKQGK